MSTFLQMQNNIADYLNRDDLTTQIKRSINRAIEFYERKSFWFQETTGSFSTIANQQSYGTADGLPSDIKEIDIVTITLSSTNKPELDRESYEDIIRLDIAATGGQPYKYAWYQNKIWFYQKPNSIWTINLSYQKNYTALSADADTNDWTTEAEDLIEARACWWLNSRIIKNVDEAAVNKADETEALNALIEKTNQLIGTGIIKPTYY
jgi:hypothetical protein